MLSDGVSHSNCAFVGWLFVSASIVGAAACLGIAERSKDTFMNLSEVVDLERRAGIACLNALRRFQFDTD